MKLSKQIKFIIWILYYCLMAGFISMIYVFRENQTALITLIVIGILLLISGLYVSYKSKSTKNIAVQTKITNQKKQIYDFIEKNDRFEINDSRYTKYVTFDNNNILETYDFKTYKPISGKKRGIKLFSSDQVIKYMKNVKLNSKRK